MIWGLIGLALVVVLVVLAITKKNLGVAIPVAAVSVFAIIAGLAWYQDYQLALSQTRIPASEVELVDMQLSDEARGVKVVSGRVRNHSRQYTLTELQVLISMEDCVDNHCEVIDQTKVTLKPDVPPGQARDFREHIAFQSALAPRGQPRLNYRVIATRGD